MRFCIIIIIVLLLVNMFASYRLLEGNWVTTADFEDSSRVKIYLNICGYKKNCRIIIFNLDSEDESRIFDGRLTFINYNPLTPLFVPTYGFVNTSEFDEIFPKWMRFRFAPLSGELKLYGKTTYADMIKM